MVWKNFLKEKLQKGIPVIGTWSNIPSVIVADIIATSGMDFIIIDSEHGPITFETAQGIAIACESRSVSPVMRVGGIEESDILKALDIGVHCIQVPNVACKEDIERLIRMAKYPPLGNRGFSPFTRAGGYSLENAKELPKIANENTLVAIHIEGKDAIDNIDEILEFSGIDIIFIGLFDISKSIGIPGEVTSAKVIDILKSVTEKINHAGKFPGTIANSIEQMAEFIGYGVKYITYSVDCEVIYSSYRKIVNEFRSNI